MINKEPIELAIHQLRVIAADKALMEHFNLGFWGNQLASHPLDTAEKVDCGFTGCFMGWAAHQQWFDRFGLVLRLTTSVHRPHETVPFDMLMRAPNSVYPMVQLASSSQFLAFTEDPGKNDSRTSRDATNAVASLFGINTMTMDRLIYPEHFAKDDEAGPGDVADKLELLLELGEEGFLDEDCAAEERRAEEFRENAG